jgi:hypothetical protein
MSGSRGWAFLKLTHFFLPVNHFFGNAEIRCHNGTDVNSQMPLRLFFISTKSKSMKPLLCISTIILTAFLQASAAEKGIADYFR